MQGMNQSNSSSTGGTARPRFLITGAKGFIGAWVVKSLVERGDSPWIFDLDTDSRRLEALLSGDQRAVVSFVAGDVTRLEDVDRAVAEHGITHVIHLAALQVPPCTANPPLGALVNVVGTLNVFEVAKRRRDLVRSVVYASSAAVFGPEEFYGHSHVPDGAPLFPGTHYGVFKQANEGNARVYYANEGISSVGLRPWAVYGVGRDQGISSGPTKAIKAAVLGRPYTIRFTGGLDLQYARDTAQAFLRATEAGVTGANVYTLRGTVIEIEAFIEKLASIVPSIRETGRTIRAEGKPLPIASDLDDSALVRDLGEPLRTPLAEGIRETAGIFARLREERRLDTKDLSE
ncbi:MAG TPA: NAD(P)-dependent oxidoreductase [Terriglobia bacterium]|nr:NAD(P)-dependent oxidoreductase [Terriglobia bacterium]